MKEIELGVDADDLAAESNEEDDVSAMLSNISPMEGSVVTDMEFQLYAEVDPSVTKVHFQLDYPGGKSSKWTEGDGNVGTNSFAAIFSSYIGSGSYTWRYKTVDNSKTEVVSQDIAFEIDQESTPFGDLRGKIAAKITGESSLAEGYKTLGIEDCAVRCDGCVDLRYGDPKGLNEVIDSLEDIWQYAKEQYGISRADVFVLASLVGAEMSASNAKNGESFPMEYSGRVNCERVVPYVEAPNGGPLIMAGPKTAPNYDTETEGMGSMSVSNFDVSSVNIKTLDESTLTSVQAAGDVTFNRAPCDYDGPCQSY